MSLEDRFWSKVERRNLLDCWPWTAALGSSRDGKSYGMIRAGKVILLAHRVSYALSRGIEVAQIPKGVVIRHRCDFKRCCNPTHLLAGTQADNVADAMARGVRGRLRRRGHKLTAHDIPVIRGRVRSGERHWQIAQDFGVSPSTISAVGSGRTWAWL